jgi:glycine betaine/proline transport system permease protein
VLDKFPSLSDSALRNIRIWIDTHFREFTRNYGESIEAFFEPLQWLLVQTEEVLIATPWPIILALVATLAWVGSRNIKITIGSVLAFILIGLFGMWDNSMRTLAMVFVATFLALAIGIPLGIIMSRSNRLQNIANPVMDLMQTMPSFVYLIPVVMLLGIGRVPGLLAVVVYAIAPVIRFTNLGIRLVRTDVLEAAQAFGATNRQKLFKVQLPLALPTIMAGVNQTVMLALAMVVIAAMIGVPGLGQPVLQAISNQYFTMGLFNGLAIVAIAIVLDRISQAYGKRLQKHLEVTAHG